MKLWHTHNVTKFDKTFIVAKNHNAVERISFKANELKKKNQIKQKSSNIASTTN